MNSDMILVLVLHILVEVILILLLCLLHSQNKTNQIKKKKKKRVSERFSKERMAKATRSLVPEYFSSTKDSPPQTGTPLPAEDPQNHSLGAEASFLIFLFVR